jgi:ATP-dependent protease ClpP protease subunit
MRKSKKLHQLQEATSDSEFISRGAVIFENTVARVINLYLCGQILGSEEYTEWYQLLRSVTPNDIVYIRVNSEGGDLFAALQLVRAIEECRGRVIISVEGLCMSAATLILLASDCYEISDHTIFMFHNYSSGAFGKGGEMFDQVSHFRTWSQKLFTSAYSGFLTPEEIKSMLDGKDIWMDAQEVVKRLKKNDPKKKSKGKTINKKSEDKKIEEVPSVSV